MRARPGSTGEREIIRKGSTRFYINEILVRIRAQMATAFNQCHKWAEPIMGAFRRKLSSDLRTFVGINGTPPTRDRWEVFILEIAKFRKQNPILVLKTI